MLNKSRKDKKICSCKQATTWYLDFDIYRCQQCMGVMKDLSRVREIIAYNEPCTGTEERNRVIESKWQKHIDYYNKIQSSFDKGWGLNGYQS